MLQTVDALIMENLPHVSKPNPVDITACKMVECFMEHAPVDTNLIMCCHYPT